MTTISPWFERIKKIDKKVNNFINGRQIPTLDKGEKISKYSPRDNSLLYEFGIGCGDDIERAVSNAAASFKDGRWSELSIIQRKSVINKLAGLIEINSEELALYECLDVGKPISVALDADIPMAVSALRECAENADKLFPPSGTDKGTTAYQVRKPIGVVGAILGWNYPLYMAALKCGPALVMGNSLVLKPSEYSPLSACKLAELAVEAGVPPGVFNVVNGAGNTVGSALAHHPNVDLISFTGSSATGKHIMQAAALSNMKRVLLECGGKSPFIIFEDCPSNLDVMAAFVVAQTFGNQGENCKSSSRLLIQESIKNDFLARVVEQAAQLIPQDPLDPDATFGALINEAHMNKVLAYIEAGKREGAELVLGGKCASVKSIEDDNELAGYYIGPTIFDKVGSTYTIAKEEIFGPVLSVMSFRDESEAVKIANDSCFGLAAYVATQNIGIAQRLGRHLNVGHLIVISSSNLNDGHVAIADEPHRESGFGFEKGLAGLSAYTTSTAVYLET